MIREEEWITGSSGLSATGW